MIERLIYSALTQGIQQLVADPNRISLFFKRAHQLSDVEAQAIQTKFLAAPPSVIHNYPRADNDKFPLYCVVLNEEAEAQKYLNDDLGVETLDDVIAYGAPRGETGFLAKGSIYRYTHHIMVISELPDLTIYYYELAKYFLLRQRDFFKQRGLLDMALTGQDLAPDPRYLPDYLFVRRLIMTSMAQHEIIADAPSDGIVRNIDGIFINDGTITGVDARVGLYNVAPED